MTMLRCFDYKLDLMRGNCGASLLLESFDIETDIVRRLSLYNYGMCCEELIKLASCCYKMLDIAGHIHLH